MSKFKAIVDFSGYTGPDLAPVVQVIHDKLLAAGATFPNLPTSPATLATLLGTFEMALAKKASGAQDDIIAFNIARHNLEVALAALGNHVNQVAKGDLALVNTSGFPYYDTARTADTAPPAAPTKVVLRHGDLSGSLVARYTPSRTHSVNEIQTTVGDPNNDALWQHAGMFSGGKATLGSLTPGTIVWVRIRTVGLAGVMGAWSDPAQIRVL